MDDACYLAEIRMFAGNYPPRNWAFCNGQTLPIASNQALFSLIGTFYGGDGSASFKLPDLRGIVPVSTGQHPGSAINWQIGQKYGAELIPQQTVNGSVQLTEANLPPHTHSAEFNQISGVSTTPVVADDANTEDPTGAKLAIPTISGTNRIYNTGTSDGNLAEGTATVQGSVAVGNTGEGTPANFTVNIPQTQNIQPTLGINYIICLEGLYPSRS
ncbi:phage tail protein [Flavicella sediminum]|uniref:phage tail protein n=1 Tax=Flavicella sediminum TaxID=2585141 RepID=UPI001122A7C1|nr:tail fiber protein [Flavicella sediminum]